MKRTTAFSIVLLLASTSVWAAAPNTSERFASGAESAAPAITIPQLLGLNGIYKVSKSTEVVPDAFLINGKIAPNVSGVSMDLSAREAVAIETLSDGKMLLTLRLADVEAGKVPNQLIISKEEFQNLGLAFESSGGTADLMAKYSGYEESEVAARGGSAPRARRHTVRMETSRRSYSRGRDGNGRIAGGGGNCVAVVKSLIGWGGGSMGNGVGATRALRARGWRPISPSNLRRGAVCSWAGGNGHNKGHVGYFDGRCFQPTYGGNCGNPGSGFRMIGCVARG
jgi:hypothetical protein